MATSPNPLEANKKPHLDTSNHQRFLIIEQLTSEVDHFQKMMMAIKQLPSSQDKKMSEAYQAYCQIITSYQDMVSVRLNIIKQLNSSR